MADFRVPVVEIKGIEPIPGADAIELAVVGDYRSVVQKGQFQVGDRAVYLPESAVLPEWLIEALGLTGKLAGAAKNRIKAIRLRGCLSQGILYQTTTMDLPIGTDVADRFYIVKYEPPIPASMSGEVVTLFGVPLKYDIENYKAYPDVFEDGELVEMTEKAHGTFCGIGVIPDLQHPDIFGVDGIVYSKGLGAKGMVFKNVPGNEGNIYVAMAKKLDLHNRIRETFPGAVVHVLGEIYGHGVQDLTYGRKDRDFAAFDINVNGAWLSRATFAVVADDLGIEIMPPLYRGPFSREAMMEVTDGKTIIGNQAHLREGVVIRPLKDRRDDRIGRVILKSVSGDYLMRKGAATEFS